EPALPPRTRRAAALRAYAERQRAGPDAHDRRRDRDLPAGGRHGGGAGGAAPAPGRPGGDRPGAPRVDSPSDAEGWPSPVDGSCLENSRGDEPPGVRIPLPPPALIRIRIRSM